MNRSSLENFKKEVNQIREYIKHIQYINDVAGYIVLERDHEQIKVLMNTIKEHF